MKVVNAWVELRAETWRAAMKFARSRRLRIIVGLLLTVGIIVSLFNYLSTHPVEVHITSKVVGAILVLVVVIIFVVLPVYSIIVTHEIRKRRQVEKALIQAKEVAERASKFKDQFLSTMSHELRTPLNAVLGFSDLLTDKRCGDLNERQQRYVSHITAGGKHLLNLINDILDLSKIEAGRLELSLEDLSVANIFGEAASALRPLAEKKKQTLSANVDRDLAVHADATRFKQVLMNLVGNAIKFTPEGGRIELSARAIENQVQVKVRDSGPGIPPEEQKRIFDAFYRIRQSGESVEGTGLGLAITESLVKLQGGTLGLESAPGKGSCFYFSLPAGSAILEPRTAHRKAPMQASGRAKVLIIEDDLTTAHLIESQLTSSGYETYSCTKPEEALEKAAELQPQAITLDLLMKPTSGWEILLLLRKDVRTANIPIIVVTIVDHSASGATLGADEYLVKPVDKKTLLEAVERCIEQRSYSSRGKSILVVEDDAPTREIIVELLRTKGYAVKGAVDGESARAQVATALPELVILDLMLPKVSGFELLVEWRASSRTAELPIFVLTSKDLTKQEKDYIREHAQSLLQKQQPWQGALVKQLQRALDKPQVAKT
jgi:signal transduction histidine kinase/DNA-binding response OmpR family regulator